MPRILIVAYGNPMRSDDGLAWRVADELEGKYPVSEVEILRVHQLAPELAETISHFECVIFIDAASETNLPPGEIRIVPVDDREPDSNQPPHFFHAISPKAVLSLGARLFAAHPHVFSATLTGGDFGHGDTLSSAVTTALPHLTERIEKLVRQILSGEAFPPRDANKP
jgi:hydrogenase maturation protease